MPLRIRRVRYRPRTGLWVECPLCKKNEGYEVDRDGDPVAKAELMELAALMDGSSPAYAIKFSADDPIGRCEFCHHRPIHVAVL